MRPILYLAPIRGYTHSLFRNIYKAHFDGFDFAIAPFITTMGSHRISPKHIRDILPENNAGFHLVPQILSNDPEGFICVAKKLYDLGYETVNWNLGCPFPMVAKKKRGSGLLPFPDLVRFILDQVLARIPNQLSIKTRTGMNTPDEILTLMPVFNQYPLQELIIHPRTGIQMYQGSADSDVFAICLENTHHQIVYNGDIKNYEIYKKLSSRFNTVNRWMIGRGAISDPFLASMIKTGTDDCVDKAQKFKVFHDALVNALVETLDGPSHVLDKMKGYWSYFYLSFQNGQKLFKQIRKINQIDSYMDRLSLFFEKEAKWQSLEEGS
ncbi:MAG: tRNA-dihydrouridine synthase family protein [Proteobacteria bacterium]|nr:tRNA-dihydrouridine synthase family protein [Pseudomonadota bacterium]